MDRSLGCHASPEQQLASQVEPTVQSEAIVNPTQRQLSLPPIAVLPHTSDDDDTGTLEVDQLFPTSDDRLSVVCEDPRSINCGDLPVVRRDPLPIGPREPQAAHSLHLNAEAQSHQITIEDFLRWSAKAQKTATHWKKRHYVDLGDPTAATKNVAVDPVTKSVCDDKFPQNATIQPKRKRRRKGRSIEIDPDYKPPSSASESDEGSQYHVATDCSPIPPPPHRRLGRKKNKLEPFSKRMLRAAVISHVDIDSSSANAVADTEGRQPLRFNVFNGFSPKKGSSTNFGGTQVVGKKKWRLVDPRTVVLPKLPSFPLVQKRAEVLQSKPRSITRWKPVPSSVRSLKLRRSASDQSGSRKDESSQASSRHPLSFVPLEIHKERCKSILNGPG